MRRKPKGDEELAERTHVVRRDPVAERMPNQYTDMEIRRIEDRRAPWLKRRRGR